MAPRIASHAGRRLHRGPRRPRRDPPAALAIGQPQVELRFLRLDVKNFEQTLDFAALRQLPRKTLDDLWLLDFDMTDSVQVVLEDSAALSPSEADAC